MRDKLLAIGATQKEDDFYFDLPLKCKEFSTVNIELKKYIERHIIQNDFDYYILTFKWDSRFVNNELRIANRFTEFESLYKAIADFKTYAEVYL